MIVTKEGNGSKVVKTIASLSAAQQNIAKPYLND